MEEIKKAVISKDGEIRCPYCNKLNGRLTGNEVIRNFKMRCRGSSGRIEHFFALDYSGMERK